MAGPLVTVLIDTYNHERFVEEAVVSALEQDFPVSDREILVVDDGSTDRTPEILRQFVPRIRLLQKANGGQASAFNAGLAEARGEIVAFLDGDDWWSREKLRRVASAFLDRPETGLVGHGIVEVFQNGRQRVETLHEECRFQANSPRGADMLRNRKHFLGTSRMALRARVLRGILPVPEALVFEADEYLFTLAAALSEVVILTEPLAYYRHHDANLFQIGQGSSARGLRKLEVLEALCAELSKQLRAHGVEPRTIGSILDAVRAEARQLRLSLCGGFPWETIATELRLLRIHHSDASFRQWLFSRMRLFPAALLPPRTYYRWRSRLGRSPAYLRLRERYLPVPMGGHLRREDKRVSP